MIILSFLLMAAKQISLGKSEILNSFLRYSEFSSTVISTDSISILFSVTIFLTAGDKVWSDLSLPRKNSTKLQVNY